uniref:NADH-cytochrome b5 reductase-like n=1 Tax=Salvator merianae TaxID=96440 RepID=A0A8D0KIW7_SALMN
MGSETWWRGSCHPRSHFLGNGLANQGTRYIFSSYVTTSSSGSCSRTDGTFRKYHGNGAPGGGPRTVQGVRGRGPRWGFGPKTNLVRRCPQHAQEQRSRSVARRKASILSQPCLGSPSPLLQPAGGGRHFPSLCSRKLMDDTEEDWLILRPREPLPSQCCGSGCKPCIYDLYQKELKQWEEAKAKNDKSLLAVKKQQGSNSELNPEAFTAFIVSCVNQLTEDTYQYTFELPGNSSLGLSLGQHIVLRGQVNGLEIQRAYTPITPVNAEGYFEVLIKCYATGLMSQYVKTWKVGDAVFWRGPFGGFPYKANQYGELFILASGTGLAPMLPILHYITENEDDETFVTLVGCFRNFENIYMKSFLQEQCHFWNIRAFYVLSKEASLENLPWSFRENTHIGRINEKLIRSMMDTCRRQPFVLICGSEKFGEDMERCLKAIGLQEDSYFIF